jgi:hypothetical protein
VRRPTTPSLSPWKVTSSTRDVLLVKIAKRSSTARMLPLMKVNRNSKGVGKEGRREESYLERGREGRTMSREE